MNTVWNRNAFTLIELLVVVSIIVILIAMLVPALEKAMTQAQKIRCATNMDAQGNCYVQYAIDNKSIMPSTVRLFGGVYPFVYWINDRGNGDVHTKLFVGYVDGVRDDGKFEPKEGKIWYCPSAGTSLVAQNEALANDAGNERQESHYGLFARVDLWESAASRPEDLSERFPGGSRILASENLFKWWVNGGWTYTHGSNSHHQLGPTNVGTPKFSGVNQLYGDGSVQWKSASKFDVERLGIGSRDRDLKWVVGGGGGHGDLYYY